MKKSFLQKVRDLVSYINNNPVVVDNKQVRRAMYNYFVKTDWNGFNTITNIVATDSKRGLDILIETHRPGILIGVRGAYIDGLKQHLIDELGRSDINIDLKECRMWYDLFD